MKLPDNYQDRSRAFHIPEELVQHYATLPSVSGKDRENIIQRYAKDRAQETTSPKERLEVYWAQVEQNIEQADREAVMHAYYLAQARQRLSATEKRQAQIERRKLASVCPICGEVTLESPDNPLETRSLNYRKVGTYPKPTDLHSCLKCYLTVLELKTEKAQAEKLGKKTRKDIVLLWLRCQMPS